MRTVVLRSRGGRWLWGELEAAPNKALALTRLRFSGDQTQGLELMEMAIQGAAMQKLVPSQSLFCCTDRFLGVVVVDVGTQGCQGPLQTG